jgi:hypothetical protein
MSIRNRNSELHASELLGYYVSTQWKYPSVLVLRTAAEWPLPRRFMLLDGEQIIGLSETSVHLQTAVFSFSC